MPEQSDEKIGKRFDDAFAEFKRTNPDATVASFYTRRHVLRNWEQEKGHNSLGAKIVTSNGEAMDFWDAGRQKAASWIERYEIAPTAKVVEYGCGTLRIAAHLISYLPKGHFFGLDVIPEFLEKGVELVGEELIAEKAPMLAVIDDEGVERAAAFEPDIVYSHAVMHHVHPDELGTYASNMSKIASKPGCRVIFNTSCHEPPVRYGNLGWAQSLEQIKDLFAPLEMISSKEGKPIKKGGYLIQPATFEFQRT